MTTNPPTSRGRQTSLAGTVILVTLAIAVLIAKQAGWIKAPSEGGGGGDSTASSSDRGSSTSSKPAPKPTPPPTPNDVAADTGAGVAVEAAFQFQRSDVWVEATGVVVKLLADDNDGDAHQKMLVRVDGTDNLTILIAHSLEAAQRVPVKEGQRIRFRGEYEWTDKGGTIHFTHDPEFTRQQAGGWIEFGGKRYE